MSFGFVAFLVCAEGLNGVVFVGLLDYSMSLRGLGVQGRFCAMQASGSARLGYGFTDGWFGMEVQTGNRVCQTSNSERKGQS